MPAKKAMAERYAACAESIRRGIDEANEHSDAADAALLTGVSRMLDHSLDFIESHQQK